MNKSELIEAIAKETELSKAAAGLDQVSHLTRERIAQPIG